MSRYRVDRVKRGALKCPVGMTSIIYLGDSHTAALEAYREANPGIDNWGQPNPNWTVAMFEYKRFISEYKQLRIK